MDTNVANTTNTDKTAVKFSVAICVYKNDDPEHFKKAVESVVNQTIQPDEIVLVVDGPIPDSIVKVIQTYEKESWFKVIHLSKNVGHGNARRIGLENCSHELVALMDADDISVSDRFENQLMCFKKDEKLSIVGGNIIEFINSIDNIVGIREVPQGDSAIKTYMKKRCPFNQQTVMVKKSDVESAGGYIDWYCEEDYYLWLRMYQCGCLFKNLKDCLVYVRVGKEMYQRRGGWEYFKSEIKLQSYMLNHGIVNIFRYISNVGIRFVIQILMSNWLRGYIFRRFARKKVN